MQYGLNQCGFPSENIEQTCAIVADAGYDGIEPNVEKDGPLTTDSGRRELRETVERFDLAVPALSTISHWEYPLSSGNDELRETGLRIGRDMIDAAVALDASAVLIVPAAIDAGTRYEEAYRRAVESVRELARYADGRGVTVAIENVQNNFLPSPEEFLAFLEDVDQAGPVEAYFDIGNAFRSGLPSRWLRTLDERIAKLHVKDWLRDAHRPTYPPQGDVDWTHVVDAFSAVDYDGWITAEVPPYASFGERMPPQVLENMRFLFEEAAGGEAR
ncbi:MULTISPECIES: sugar phosphate isomerase/epimerase family protein [Natrialbaceae]|uniref:sugar phosphate isomerase/epimerase family protein n=1 Tax=Natrialbaceae TaxID=1644061 RepID=UPI00207D54AF|nr:sugar phosphate isomerase/epimerase family protein [Natronococcus sp. CG52]